MLMRYVTHCLDNAAGLRLLAEPDGLQSLDLTQDEFMFPEASLQPSEDVMLACQCS